jgi:hypothetical protein
MQAQQICLLASQNAKGGGTVYGAGMTPIAGQFLNVVLEDLKLNRNLKVNRVTQTFSVSPGGYGPFLLESDYLRTYDLFYPLPVSGGGTASSDTQFLVPITMEQFDAEFKSPSVSNYPYEFATDLSTQAQVWSGGVQGSGTMTSAGQMFIYPQTSGAIVMTHRYMKNQPDILIPELSIITPWFAFTDYLIHATSARLMGVTGDDRASTWLKESEEMLRPWLIMEGDEQETVRSVKLDPRHFKFHRGLKPTKASPF